MQFMQGCTTDIQPFQNGAKQYANIHVKLYFSDVKNWYLVINIWKCSGFYFCLIIYQNGFKMIMAHGIFVFRSYSNKWKVLKKNLILLFYLFLSLCNVKLCWQSYDNEHLYELIGWLRNNDNDLM